ncbi:MAG: NINE protein [Alphaproteobacteria bacterium]|nr:NINE protein [Alphaproteobacteria bacterium]
MNDVDNLSKLADLKEKGLISEAEFTQQKERILKELENPSLKAPKNRAVYILLALFFGGFGIHNFYAGYTGKGLTQLLLTILLFWLVIPLIIVGIWVLIEIITVTKDAKGVPFN